MAWSLGLHVMMASGMLYVWFEVLWYPAWLPLFQEVLSLSCLSEGASHSDFLYPRVANTKPVTKQQAEETSTAFGEGF